MHFSLSWCVPEGKYLARLYAKPGVTTDSSSCGVNKIKCRLLNKDDLALRNNFGVGVITCNTWRSPQACIRFGRPSLIWRGAIVEVITRLCRKAEVTTSGNASTPEIAFSLAKPARVIVYGDLNYYYFRVGWFRIMGYEEKCSKTVFENEKFDKLSIPQHNPVLQIAPKKMTRETRASHML